MSIIDLKLNKNMIDINFEGYKLSLDPIPILRQPVIDGVKCIELGNDDFSYLQTRMALLQNYLFQDSYSQNCIFYINKKGNVMWTSLGQDGRLGASRSVWSVPSHSADREAFTIVFPGADWALLCDGNNIHALYTPSRAAGEPWTVQLTAPPFTQNQISSFDSTSKRRQISAILDGSKSALELGVMTTEGQNNQIWTKKRTRKLVGFTFPEYAAIDKIGDAICIVSKDDYSLYFDSEKMVNLNVSTNNTNAQLPKYSYIQSSNSINIYFKLLDETRKSDLQINFRPTHLEVFIKGKLVLSGQLDHCIDTNACTWTIEEGRLEVFLCKAEEGLMWHELIKGNRDGEELMDKALVAEIHERLSHLTSETETASNHEVPFNLDQLEECDSSTEELIFQRIDGNEHKETHRAILSGHQWLFSNQMCPDSLPTICLRHDVDGILWQPKNVCSDGDNEHFKMNHLTTFLALGYVLASKQDKKFITSSPTFEYSVVSDCSRHLYLYCQPESLHSSLELRNRKTGESIASIAKQYVISFEQCDKILGLRASSDCIFVLSKDMLYAVKVCCK